MHIDRCEAVAQEFEAERTIIGLELFKNSDTYDWKPSEQQSFKKITLFAEGMRPSSVRVLASLLAAVFRVGRGDYFLCHYERPYIVILAYFLRASGLRVFSMNCSKFDDLPRSSMREFLKRFFLLPYRGAMASGVRSKDYYRFLGVKAERILGEYNTLSIDRIRRAAGSEPAPGGTPFEQRVFLSIARFVPKKNLGMLIEAYGAYHKITERPRKLVLCGGGALEAELKGRVAELGLEADVVFRGFLQSEDVSKLMAEGVALLLPSVEEQFGNVVIEALALGLPVILSDNCGARDTLVRTGINGFVIEPDNPVGMARFMKLLGEDRQLWSSFAASSAQFAERCDVKQFSKGIRGLVSM